MGGKGEGDLYFYILISIIIGKHGKMYFLKFQQNHTMNKIFTFFEVGEEDSFLKLLYKNFSPLAQLECLRKGGNWFEIWGGGFNPTTSGGGGPDFKNSKKRNTEPWSKPTSKISAL